MFVEKLSKKQIFDFVKTLPDYTIAIDIDCQKEGWCDGFILFTVDFMQRPKRTTSSIITATDTKFLFNKDEKWIKYLYSIFGDEYKNWYKKQQEEEFKRLFETK